MVRSAASGRRRERKSARNGDGGAARPPAADPRREGKAEAAVSAGRGPGRIAAGAEAGSAGGAGEGETIGSWIAGLWAGEETTMQQPCGGRAERPCNGHALAMQRPGEGDANAMRRPCRGRAWRAKAGRRLPWPCTVIGKRSLGLPLHLCIDTPLPVHTELVITIASHRRHNSKSSCSPLPGPATGVDGRAPVTGRTAPDGTATAAAAAPTMVVAEAAGVTSRERGCPTHRRRCGGVPGCFRLFWVVFCTCDRREAEGEDLLREEGSTGRIRSNPALVPPPPCRWLLGQALGRTHLLT